MPKVRLAFATLLASVIVLSASQSNDADSFADTFLLTMIDVLSKVSVGVLISRTR